MRKFWSAILAGMVLAGCSLPERPVPDGTDVPLVPGKGQLVIRWAPEPGRAVLGSGWAQGVADAFELLLVGPGGPRAVSVTGSGTQAVSLDAGTYRVLVLAGVKRSSGSSTAYLVGSAAADGVAVVEGARTPVNLTLRSVDLGWEGGSPAYWKGSLTVRATGASRNPWVGMSLAGASTTQRPRLRCNELYGGYKETVVTGTPDAWKAEAVGTVPASGTGFNVDLVGAGLVFVGSDGLWAPTAGITGFTWSWPSRPDLAETHPLAAPTVLAVSCGPPPTGVDVSLAWE